MVTVCSGLHTRNGARAVSDVTRNPGTAGSVARMRLEHPHRTERFGAVHIRELQRVVELDSGEERLVRRADDLGPTCSVSTEAIRSIERDLVIVVPCMNETRKVIEGVLSGIPHDCLIVLVSNSDRQPVDRYAMEADSVEQFCRFAERPAIAVHQRDPGLAAALRAAGMPEMVGDDRSCPGDVFQADLWQGEGPSTGPCAAQIGPAP